MVRTPSQYIPSSTTLISIENGFSFLLFLLKMLFQNQVEVDGGKSLDLSNYPCIFMVFWPPLTLALFVSTHIIMFLKPSIMVSLQRWKEQYFVNVGTDCGLTIAGFYYVCFSCSDGSINGFYYDPNSRYEFKL